MSFTSYSVPPTSTVTVASVCGALSASITNCTLPSASSAGRARMLKPVASLSSVMVAEAVSFTMTSFSRLSAPETPVILALMVAVP